MISFLEGKIEHINDKNIILNTGGIGYSVHVMPKIAMALKLVQTEPVKLFIHSQLNMREGVFDLYGFKSKEDLEMFHLILSVNGIGPKGAMNIMSTVEPRHLKAAVVNDDAAYLKKVSGLGPKTAQRLILELKNKVDYIDMGDMAGVNLSEEHQAVEALMALGYSQSVAQETLKDIKTSRLEDRVREALKILGKR
jgi:Holliday junction DNA helicase RuvA